MHQVVYLLQLAHPNDFDRCLDETSTEEINRFGGILTISNIGTLYCDAPNNRFEDWRF